MWRFPGRISIGTLPIEDMLWPVPFIDAFLIATYALFLGKTTINKLDRQIIVEVPSRWAIKPNTETLSIIQKEINPDAELAIIKTTYQIKFFTSKPNSGMDRIDQCESARWTAR